MIVVKLASAAVGRLLLLVADRRVGWASFKFHSGLLWPRVSSQHNCGSLATIELAGRPSGAHDNGRPAGAPPTANKLDESRLRDATVVLVVVEGAGGVS